MTLQLTVTSADITSTTTTASVFDTTVTTLAIGGATTTLNLAGGSGSTGCTINASGDLTCSGTLSGSGITATALKWNSLTNPDGALTLAMGTNPTTFGWTPTGALDAWTMNIVNNGGATTAQNGLVINNAVAGSFTDTTTENLLLIQQLDTITVGTTTVANGIKIDSAASSAMTNGLYITNSAGNLTTGINIADTAGGTLTTGIVISGTVTNAMDAGNFPIINIGSANTDFNTSGGLNLAENLSIQGTTGLSFITGVGGDITFANLEKIDNDTNGTINITAPTLLLTGGTSTVTDQTTFSLFNTTTTTLNIGGAATTLNIGPTGSGASTIALSGGSADTGCTIDGSTGNLTCSGIIAGSAATSKWNAITNPDGNLTLAMAGFTTAFNWVNDTTSLDNITYSLSNTGGTAGTDNLFVLSNALSANTTGDLNTEALLLLDQADTTAAGTTILDSAIKITNSGGSTLTNGITIGSGAQVITNGLNMGGSTGIVTDLVLQNSETIDNNVDGTVNIGTTIFKLTGGTSIVTDQTSFDLFNTTTTTLNIGGAATSLNLAGGSGSAGVLSTDQET
jgi:hypothetical protein